MKYELGNIPLVDGGKPFYTQKTIPIKDYRGNLLCNLCIAPGPKIAIARKKSREIGFKTLQEMDILEVIEIYHEASKVYKRRVPITPEISLNMKEFGQLLSLTTGIPIQFCMESINLVQHCLERNMIYRILEAGSPTGDINIYDKFIGVRGGVEHAFAPRGKNLGVCLPSNHPTVPIIPMFVPAHKIPILFRPSRKDPFASLRMVQALCEAGLPEYSISYFATGHDLVYDFITKTDLGMIFGSEKTVSPYREIPSVKVYGPCYSKILVDREFLDDRYGFCLDITYKSIMNTSGRGGINCSDIIFINKDESSAGKTFNFMEFIDDLCMMLNEAKILEPLHPHAEVGAVPEIKARSYFEEIRGNMTSKDLDYTCFVRNGRREVPFKQNDIIVSIDG
ncbi:MAG: aldehyde dehydrogenase family protein, partial [Candidatus Helarchaeales archaeon]